MNWLTANEVNVNRFEVERSDDGQNFETVGTILPGINSYTFTDVDIFSSKSTVFYRLNSIDTDGRFGYSNIIRLNSNSLNQLTVFPNPVKNLVTISGLQPNGTISLFTATGILIKKQIVTEQSITLDMSQQSKGIYLLEYIHNSEVSTVKIVKQ